MAGYRPRVIALSKKQGQSFGFFLRVEQGEEGHLIRNLEMGGPAELAGLRDGDRILRVNGTYVDGMEHPLVVNLVRGSNTSVSFHVLDEASYKQAKTEGVDLSDPRPRPAQSQPAMNGVAGPAPKPKLCYLVKTSAGYGFSLRSINGEQGVFITELGAGGVAERAGVRTNDRLVEVNGENVESQSHDQIVGVIKAAGGELVFLLVDEDTDRFYKSKRMRLGAGLATVKLLPHKPRIADLTKGPDGYGYFLRAEPNKTGHFIKNIDKGSPADKAGLKEMDRLVAVDGEEVSHCSHDQVVDRIRQCGKKCCLLVVDSETDNMYKKGGASPLLFWEEMRGSLLPPSYPAATSDPAPVLVATPKPAATPWEAELKPKLCKMDKSPAGYGFHLNGIQGVTGQYIKEVVKGGAAARAGLENDDIVVEVDGVNVEQKTHEDVVELIRKSGSSLVLLVAEKRTYDQLKAKGVAITALLLAPPSPARSHTPPATLKEVREEEEEEREEKKEEEREKREEEEEEKKEEEREKEEEKKEEKREEEEEREKREKEEEKKEEKREEEEEREKEEEKREEEEEEKKKEEKKKEEAARPDTPPVQTRDRAPSSSSSSSDDERF